MSYYVYILTNYTNTTLYIGVTNDIIRRVMFHRNKKGGVFTRRYHLTKLVFTEEYESIYDALEREKQLKRWHRKWKWNLIKEYNPELKDLLL